MIITEKQVKDLMNRIGMEEQIQNAYKDIILYGKAKIEVPTKKCDEPREVK